MPTSNVKLQYVAPTIQRQVYASLNEQYQTDSLVRPVSKGSPTLELSFPSYGSDKYDIRADTLLKTSSAKIE